MYNGNLNISVEYPLFPWDFLRETRGPQQLPLGTAIPLTFINGIILVTGLLGNIAVCVVIIRHPSMHTATNYYLFNLAVSDLTLLIFGLPNDVLIYWHQYPWTLGVAFCKVRALISEMASYVSVLTIVAFSTERYLAICHPLYLYTMSGLNRAIKIIGCVWFISFISALPFSLYTQVHKEEYPDGSGNIVEESAFCAMLDQPVLLSEVSTIIFFIIPMIIIAIEYICMGIEISKRTRQSYINDNRGSRKSQAHKAIIRMLAVVVVGFFLCWAPFHAQRLLYIYGAESPYFHTINEWMFYITGILYYFSSTLNPILYNVMSHRYRIAFREVLCGKKTRKRELTRNSTFRETAISSLSHHKNTAHIKSKIAQKNGHFSTQKLASSEEELQLFPDDIMKITTKEGNTLLYQCNTKGQDLDFCDIEPNSEICI